MAQPTSRLHFTENWPDAAKFGLDAILIYDRKLDTLAKGFSGWSRKFPARYKVTSGESLKDLAGFSRHVEAVLRLTREMSARDLCVVVAGGGSVGDFGGFLASVLKRGVRLVHVPTTWLAAIDSAHGGKTALNAGRSKNQIGTFYPATDIYLIRPVLLAQPEARARDAFGEFAKMAMIDGGAWVRRLERSRASDPSRFLWANLRSVIQAKYKVVTKDPLEKKGHRQVLNLGHTFGHVLEKALGLSHGEAVAQGLFFTLAWSFRRGWLSLEGYGEERAFLQDQLGFVPLVQGAGYTRRRPSRQTARELLLLDKKRSSRDEVTFIFLKSRGWVIRKRVGVEDVLHEAREQGWIK